MTVNLHPRFASVASCAAIVAVTAASIGCGGRPPAGPVPTLRLVDLFEPAAVSGSAVGPRELPRTEWRFDGEAPAPPARGPASATRGWVAGPGVEGLTLRDGRLAGRTSNDFPVIHFARTTGFDTLDLVHAVEIRMRASAGGAVWVQGVAGERVDLAQQVVAGRGLPWPFSTSLTPGDEIRTYTITPATHVVGSAMRHLLIRPTDAAKATFEVESVRIIYRREYLSSIPSGIAWQGLKEIYRESLAARSPETIAFSVDLPDRPWLDLAVGTLEDAPTTFRVSVRPDGGSGEPETLLEHTVTTPHRWEPRPIDLERWAGRRVTLSMTLDAADAGTLGFWGAPVIRTRTDAAARERPHGVIVIQADTLRRDHLDVYGYARPTAPIVKQLAAEGVRFDSYTVQATWTKVSTPSLMTSLYPSSHGVVNFSDHLPAAANTMAESFRAAGYATLAYTSVLFTGQFTNLHQGFEELHEDGSVTARGSSKTAREFVDRFQAWLEAHPDTPFFTFLHVFDPHDPYEPNRPYDTMWADPAHKEEHQQQLQAVRKVIQEPLLRLFGMPSRDDLKKAGFEPQKFVDHDKDWYDGSIRGMDVEVGRLMETLRRIGIDERTLVVFLSDHGEEFHEHGRMFHGQTVYGELTRVPFIARWPARLATGRVVDDVVQSIDVMPTLLELSGIQPPPGVQGQSFVPLLVADAGGRSWARRPAISEKPLTDPRGGAAPPPHDTESYAIVDAGWKLVHNTARPRGGPEFELYDFSKDPLDAHDVAGANPEIVQRLAKALAGWKEMATAARLKPDSEAAKTLSPEQLQRLRSLGYVR
jgi:arylsulfatase A-like enzyme